MNIITMNSVRIILTTLLCTATISTIVAQETKAGIIDKTGNFVVYPQYDEIGVFHEGLACVENDGKWGFIDKTGREVISPQYDEAAVFQDGLAVVKKNGRYVIIDKSGKEFTMSHYRSFGSFVDGLAVVVTDDCEMIKSDYHDYYDRKCFTFKKGFIDRTGKEIIPPQYAFAYSFSEGLAIVANISDSNHYCEWLYALFPPDYGDNGCKWGAIDKTGKVVVPLQYDFVESFNGGLASVRKDDKWGLIDKTGREIVPPRYYDKYSHPDDMMKFYEGLAIVRRDRNYGMIDRTGKEIIPPLYDRIGYFIEGLAPVKKNGKWGFIDKSGKIVVQPQYEDVFDEGRDEGYDGEGWLERVKKNGKWGFVDKTGKEIVAPIYEWVTGFQEGFAALEIGCGWREDLGVYCCSRGFIDKTGTIVVPPRYDQVGYFHEGLAAVQKGYKLGFIDKTGKEVIPLIYDNYMGLLSLGGDVRFQEGYVAVEIDGKWGFIDKTGSVTIPIQYKEVRDFSEGLAVVYVNSEDVALFEKYHKKIQTIWNECNQKLMNDPYNTENVQLDPISIMEYFWNPRLSTITDSIATELKQKTKELQNDCYNRLKTNKPEIFAGIYMRLHPEAKSVWENLKLECRCNNNTEAELVIKIADNNIPQCICRNEYWNQYGILFSSRTEFDSIYNISEKAFLDDVTLRQSLKSNIQEIASLLSGLKSAKFKDGLTGKQENVIRILQKVQYHQGKYYYDEVVEMMFTVDASMTKEWEKNGQLFSSRNEFYEAYVSGNYKDVLKEKKSK